MPDNGGSGSLDVLLVEDGQALVEMHRLEFVSESHWLTEHDLHERYSDFDSIVA